MHPRDLRLSVAALLLVSCGEPQEMADSDTEVLGPRPLISAHTWAQAPADGDPFSAMRPAGTVCDESGLNVEPATEGDALEIDTELCNFVTVEQGALNMAEAGEPLNIHLWHSDLKADEPATGYVGIALGDTIVWERDVPIPSEAGSLDDTVILPVPIGIGDPVRVHVHNHGNNTWTVLKLEIE